MAAGCNAKASAINFGAIKERRRGEEEEEEKATQQMAVCKDFVGSMEISC